MHYNIRAGDSFEAEFSSVHYSPGQGDTAVLHITRAKESIAVPGDPAADGWTFQISAEQTSMFTPGVATVSIRVTRQDGKVFTVRSDVAVIKADPATIESSAEFAERMVNAIERALEGGLSADERVAFSSISVGGRSLTLLSRAELIEERAYWIRALKKRLGRYRDVKSRPVNTNSILGARP